MAKRVWVTYLMWMVGGLFGLHHFYLDRNRHAFVWLCTVGGVFGCGWARDLFRIPHYVRQANEEEEFIQEGKHGLRWNRPPPFSIVRFVGELIVGAMFGFVFRAAPPEELLKRSRMLHSLWSVMVPLAVALVGNIGREAASTRTAIVGAYIGLPLLWINPGNITIVAVLSTFVVNTKGTRWRQERRSSSLSLKLGVIGLWLLYVSMLILAVYNNGYIQSGHGRPVRVHVAVNNFLRSPEWADAKKTMKGLADHISRHGIGSLYDALMVVVDPGSNHHAYRILGVSPGASEKEIRASYLKLVREWHPDKQEDKDTRRKVSERFIEIQAAYETLSSMKSHQRNSKERYRADDEL